MSVTAAQGFVAAGCHAGIKRRRYDMALLATDDGKPVATAAVFTQNKFAAPPVQLVRPLVQQQRVAMVVDQPRLIQIDHLSILRYAQDDTHRES